MKSLSSFYMTLNLSLLISCLSVLFFDALTIRYKISPRLVLKVVPILFLITFLAVIKMPLGNETGLRPAVQVWSGVSRGDGEASYVAFPALQKATSSGFLLSSQIKDASAILLIFSIVFGVFFLSFQYYTLRKKIHKMLRLKKNGSISVYLSEEESIPFSFSLFQNYIVMPSHLLGDRTTWRLSRMHEAMHIKLFHPQFLFLLNILRAFCIWNPAIHIFIRRISEWQEFACDEELLGQKQISPKAYCSCLLRVAETASLRQFPKGTVGSLGLTGNPLKRRVIMLLQNKQKTHRLVPVIAIALVLATSVCLAGLSKVLVQDRRISLEEATALMSQTKSGAEIPLVMNEMVLKELNRYIGTPEGREFVKAALTRMPQYSEMIKEKLKQYQIPEEVIAVPLIESGFKNHPASGPYFSAGLWQFISQTARRYHLRVDAEIDERLDEEKETIAAMQYLTDLQSLFHDWRLSLRSYNEGEQKVQGLIKKFHTADPWELEKIAPSSERYLPKVTAMMLILKNPQLVD